MEHDTEIPTKSRSHKKSKDNPERKSEKKRKRITTGEDLEPSPTKKHRSYESQKPLTPSTALPSLSDSTRKSPFYLQTSSLYLPLSPISQLYPLQGVCAEHLSPLILTYYPPFHGVVLSYSNAELSESPRRGSGHEERGRVLAQSIDEYAVSFVWVTADFLIFKPQRGGWIEGWVNLQNEGHIGLVCWNLFNASIERKRLPKEWKWVAGGMNVRPRRKSESGNVSSHSDEAEQDPGVDGSEDAEGYFKDPEGHKIEGPLRFRVKDVETSSASDREKGFISIEGTMLNDEGERDLLEQENLRNRGKNRGLFSSRKQFEHTMSGALTDGHVDGATDIDGPHEPKHRITY
ncbi:hypothetical protein MMC24_004982 [Lignoscripta atroalba]|nr:hypothetical protein [Lignoscripta atroalba]